MKNDSGPAEDLLLPADAAPVAIRTTFADFPFQRDDEMDLEKIWDNSIPSINSATNEAPKKRNDSQSAAKFSKLLGTNFTIRISMPFESAKVLTWPTHRPTGEPCTLRIFSTFLCAWNKYGEGALRNEDVLFYFVPYCVWVTVIEAIGTLHCRFDFENSGGIWSYSLAIPYYKHVEIPPQLL